MHATIRLVHLHADVLLEHGRVARGCVDHNPVSADVRRVDPDDVARAGAEHHLAGQNAVRAEVSHRYRAAVIDQPCTSPTCTVGDLVVDDLVSVSSSGFSVSSFGFVASFGFGHRFGCGYRLGFSYRFSSMFVSVSSCVFVSRFGLVSRFMYVSRFGFVSVFMYVSRFTMCW